MFKEKFSSSAHMDLFERPRDISAQTANVIRKSSSLARLSTPLPSSKSSSIHFNLTLGSLVNMLVAFALKLETTSDAWHSSGSYAKFTRSSQRVPFPSSEFTLSSASTRTFQSNQRFKNSGFSHKIFALFFVAVFVLSSTSCVFANPVAGAQHYRQRHYSRNHFLSNEPGRPPQQRTSTSVSNRVSRIQPTRPLPPQQPDWFYGVNHIPFSSKQRETWSRSLPQNGTYIVDTHNQSSPGSRPPNSDLDYLSHNMSRAPVDMHGAFNQGGRSQYCSDSLFKCITHSVIFVCMIVCTIIGNSFVIAAVILERNLHNNVANYLIVSLASADLTVAIMVMPIGAYQEVYETWTLGKVLCDIWTSFDVLCCTASILHLVAIAFDRYKAITNVDYGAKRTVKRILSMIITIWSISLTVAVSPHIFGLSYPEGQAKCELTNNLTYQLVSTLAAFYLPLIVMCVIYWNIFQSAKFRIRKKAFADRPSHAATPTNRTANHSIASTVTQSVKNNKSPTHTELNAQRKDEKGSNSHLNENTKSQSDGASKSDENNNSSHVEHSVHESETNECHTKNTPQTMSPKGSGYKSVSQSTQSFKSLGKSPSSSDKKLNEHHRSPGKHDQKKKKLVKKESTMSRSSYSENDSNEDSNTDEDEDEEDDYDDEEVTSSSERANLKRSRRKKKKAHHNENKSANRGNERIKKFIFRNKFLIKHLSSLQSKRAQEQPPVTENAHDQLMSVSGTTDLVTISSIPPQLDLVPEHETVLNSSEQRAQTDPAINQVNKSEQKSAATPTSGVNWSFLLSKMNITRSTNKVDKIATPEGSPTKNGNVKNKFMRFVELSKSKQKDSNASSDDQKSQKANKTKKLKDMKSFSTSRSLSSRSSGSSRSRSVSPKQKELKSPDKRVNFSTAHPSQLTPSKTLEICSQVSSSRSIANDSNVPLRSKLKKTKSQDDSHELYLIKGSRSRIDIDSPEKPLPTSLSAAGGLVSPNHNLTASPSKPSMHNSNSQLNSKSGATQEMSEKSVNVNKLNDNLNNLLKTIISDELKDEEELKNEMHQNQSTNETPVHQSASNLSNTTPPSQQQQQQQQTQQPPPLPQPTNPSNSSSPRKPSRSRRVHGNVRDETGANTVVTFKGTNLTSTMLKKKNRIDMKRERKAAKTLGVIMSCFIICWLPFFLMQILFSVGQEWSFVQAIQASPLSTILTWSGYLNSLLNPVIYTIFSPDFRGAFKKILFGKYHSKKKRNFYR